MKPGAHASQKLLKVKVGTSDDRARMHAVASAAPNAEIILDANEGWTESNIREHLLLAAELHIGLIEQPLPAGKDELLAHIPHPVPICADESVHTLADLQALSDRYDAINIKLDKTGGLTEALLMRDRARELGFGVMVGCMVGTSLAHGARGAVGPGRRLGRSRRSAADGEGPFARPGLFRIAGFAPLRRSLGIVSDAPRQPE